MEILAHRGFWKTPQEKNRATALCRAFENGFGIETDIRDYRGQLVISHNVAEEGALPAEEMFKAYTELGKPGTLALNVKADGIQVLLEPLLEKYGIEKYFLFDMSVPELIVNDSRGLTYFTRHSDVEDICVMYDRASGVWMDSFYDFHWLSVDKMRRHIDAGKTICIVSPELHGQAHLETWNMLKEHHLSEMDSVILCTDYPDRAKEYFYGKD